MLYTKPSSPQGYSLNEFIGSGGFSQVWMGTHLYSDKIVAIKVIKKTELIKEENRKRFERELMIHKSAIHPFIVPLYDHVENIMNHYLVMEYLPGGTLMDRIHKGKPMNVLEMQHYITQIVSALDYLHNSLNVCHQDIKPQNILIDKSNNIRIIDFGFSTRFDSVNTCEISTCGSPKYASPELYAKVPHGKPVDIWSLGVIIYLCATGYYPFEHSSIERLSTMILHQDPLIPDELDSNLKDLIKGMLSKQPESRLTCNEIKKSEWLLQAQHENQDIQITNITCNNKKMMEIIKDKSSIVRMTKRYSSPNVNESLSLQEKLCASGRFKPIGQTPKKIIMKKNGWNTFDCGKSISPLCLKEDGIEK